MQLGGEICPINSLCSTNSTLSALELKLSLLDDLLTSSSFSDTTTLPVFRHSAPDHSKLRYPSWVGSNFSVLASLNQSLPVAYRGGRRVWGVQTPPWNFEGPPKLCQSQPDLWKLLKIAEFRMPTLQDIRKKGSRILKLPRFAIVLH
jgi:hypothetical protein